MATIAKKKRKGNVVTIDFTGVKSGGATIPEGRYKAKIINVEQKAGKESGEPYSEVTWEITSEKCNSREVPYDVYSHQPNSLWRLKGLLEALGVEVPDGDHDIDWDEIISDETECIIEITHKDSQEGDRKYARVTGVDTLDSGNTVDDEEGEEIKKSSRTSKDSKVARSSGKSKGEEEEENEEEDDEPPTNKKIKKRAKVKFKDEKGKLTKGEITEIDGDTATVETSGGDAYEMDIEELTII